MDKFTLNNLLIDFRNIPEEYVAHYKKNYDL